MYSDLIGQFSKTLTNLDTILGKATAYAETRGFPVDNFVGLRLAPDMLPFWRQVTIACDAAKAGAAAWAQIDAPKFEDNETTMVQLRDRIAKTQAFLASIPAEDFAKTTAQTIVKIPFPAGKALYAPEAALSRTTPNFFFHVSMAYAILRSGGVPIGKGDYLGQLNLFDA